MNSLYDQMTHLLSPKSLVIVGASADHSKYTGRTVKYILKYRYPGKLYAVNPGRTEVAGIPCFPSVKDLPEAVDTAFIQIAAKAVPGVIEQCIAKGVKSIIIHAAGLGESGEEGKKTQERIRAQIREAGVRVVGPNCAGIVNMTQPMILSPIACYEIDDLPVGRIGLISQSGGLTGAYVSRAADRGIGFSYVISTGNEMDLGVSEFAHYLLRDEHTDAIAIFLEALRNVEMFREVAVEALKRRKPIVVLKVGRTEVGARAAASHTGALTGADAIYDAFFRQYGIVRVETLEDLFEVPALFCKTKPPKGRNVGIITTTGGGATIVLEAAAQAGLQFPPPSDGAIREATAFLPSFAAKANPMDVTMSGTGGGFKKGLELLVKDDTFDMIVGVVGTSSQFEPQLGVQPIVEVCREAQKPLAAFCNPNAADALRLFEANGIPSFRTPEACGRGLGYLVKYGEAVGEFDRAKGQRRTADPETPAAAAARDILGNAGSVLNEYMSKRVLAAYGIAVTREKLTGNVDEAKQAAREIGYPVVMKVMSADIPHKTEAGVIKTGDPIGERACGILRGAPGKGEAVQGQRADRRRPDPGDGPKGSGDDHRHETGRQLRSRHHGRTGGDLRRGIQGRCFPRPAHLPSGCPGDDRRDQGGETPERLPGDGEDGLRGDRGGADERCGPFAGSRRSDPGARHQPPDRLPGGKGDQGRGCPDLPVGASKKLLDGNYTTEVRNDHGFSIQR